MSPGTAKAHTGAMVKFTSRVTGDLLMLSTDGKRVLMLIGKQIGPMGIILPEQMDEAERKLQSAAVLDEALRRERPPQQVHPEDGEPVALKNRALPLVRMLRSCREEQEPIIWEMV
jgi:hypothetical protein